MFNKGDVVVYSASGVCEVEEISTKSFGSFSAEYYVLRPLMQKAATVFVPTQNGALTKKIHPILTRSEFEAVFASLKSLAPIRPQSEGERQQKFTEILESGDRAGLMLMVYDLYNYSREQQQNGRRLHIGDEKLLRTAENMLFEEVAYVFEIDKTAADEFIKSKF
ncbi:MAG: hypothetical protein IJ027_05850 [Oscillospiraceae bacterium]|nr:hypothetical protein [Oscillospiraceae bacterium]